MFNVAYDELKEASMKRSTLSITLGTLLVITLLVAGWLFYVNNKKLASTNPSTPPPQSTQKSEEKPPTKTEEVTNKYSSQKGVSIIVDAPKTDSIVKSPLAVTGQVPGNWSFEASFPLKLVDSNGTVLAQGPATLHGDWMTDNLVPFTGQLTFSSPSTNTGFLILERDNPSGLPEKEDSVRIPVKFGD